MRPVERMRPILDLLYKAWETAPDMRLGQLIENIGIGYHTEDLNEAVVRICSFAGLSVNENILWGTRGKDGKSPLMYKRLGSLETSHLEAIIRDSNTYRETIYGRICVQPLAEEMRVAITTIINERNKAEHSPALLSMRGSGDKAMTEEDVSV